MSTEYQNRAGSIQMELSSYLNLDYNNDSLNVQGLKSKVMNLLFFMSDMARELDRLKDMHTVQEHVPESDVSHSALHGGSRYDIAKVDH